MRIALSLSAAMLLASCSLPAAGPTTSAIVDKNGNAERPFALVDVGLSSIEIQRLHRQPSFAERFGTGTPRLDLRIAPGDVISVSL